MGSADRSVCGGEPRSEETRFGPVYDSAPGPRPRDTRSFQGWRSAICQGTLCGRPPTRLGMLADPSGVTLAVDHKDNFPKLLGSLETKLRASENSQFQGEIERETRKHFEVNKNKSYRKGVGGQGAHGTQRLC